MRNIVFLLKGNGTHTYAHRQIQEEMAKSVLDFTIEEGALFCI